MIDAGCGRVGRAEESQGMAESVVELAIMSVKDRITMEQEGVSMFCNTTIEANSVNFFENT